MASDFSDRLQFQKEQKALHFFVPHLSLNKTLNVHWLKAAKQEREEWPKKKERIKNILLN